MQRERERDVMNTEEVRWNEHSEAKKERKRGKKHAETMNKREKRTREHKRTFSCRLVIAFYCFVPFIARLRATVIDRMHPISSLKAVLSADGIYFKGMVLTVICVPAFKTYLSEKKTADTIPRAPIPA